MCVLRVVLLAATLAALQVDRGVAEYSVYIAEDHLKTYYMGTDYEDLITGKNRWCLTLHSVAYIHRVVHVLLLQTFRYKAVHVCTCMYLI